MPDLYANVRLKDVDTFLDYSKLNNEDEGEIPDHYVKHIDTVYKEDQNTSEKFWSFTKKIYEITEEKKKELIKHGVNISPSDYEWVIDLFEKTAINDNF